MHQDFAQSKYVLGSPKWSENESIINSEITMLDTTKTAVHS